MATISSCRSCLCPALDSVLDLGSTPLANALLTEEQLNKPEERYPLHLVRCQRCSLLQITENVPAEKLFAHYFYRSSFSDAFLAHCKILADRLMDERRLNEQSLVIDIASNDGYLLQFYRERGVPVLGIEPAGNIAVIAQEEGIDTRNMFFTDDTAKQLVSEGKQADVIHAHNVMPHVADQRDFAAGIRTLLKPEGIAVIEFAYAVDTIENTEFDQIYHEHMCYFSLTSFAYLCEQFGLTVTRAERIPVHGGSLRVFLMHKDTMPFDKLRAPSAADGETVADLLEIEKEWGVGDRRTYQAFRERVIILRYDLMDLLLKLKSEGKYIAVYGASAKGATLMNYFEIDRRIVDYIVDRSTMKQGHYAPGTHLKIEPVEKLLDDEPDYVLLLTWNFADEILEQQKAYRAKGGQFIIPVPEVRVV
jgi:2-polyprenyl-3-methyl-5-hydroxy-6-metoxy-1,4-benzoquinol methylase